MIMTALDFRIVRYMPWETARSMSERLNSHYATASAALRALSGGGPMGLTPDHVRASAAWREARTAYDVTFADLRAFNAVYVKRFAREIRAERDARRRAKTNDLQTPS